MSRSPRKYRDRRGWVDMDTSARLLLRGLQAWEAGDMPTHLLPSTSRLLQLEQLIGDAIDEREANRAKLEP